MEDYKGSIEYTTQKNNYKYNGKELVEEMGWNNLLYGARNYDAAIGRFGTVDPLASDYPSWTPYHYVHNNPIRLVDPKGMGAEDWVEQGGKMVYDNRVTNQADATALYGEGAIHRPIGHSYTASNGSSITLGNFGFFKENA
jgi:RHS repeat-associated protein